MRRSLIASAFLALLCHGRPSPMSAQSIDDLKLQVHGFATQSFIYSTENNWNTTNSSDGSPAWTEAVVNVTTQPISKLRIGVQARYFLLGTLGNTITLDWAQADYKLNERIGFRAGKVKTPAGLLNESQDIDPAQLWVLLPSSVYPIASRNSVLSHYGGVVYGSVPVGESLGKLIYRGFGGQRVLGSNDGFFQPLRDGGITLPDGETGPMYGGALNWETPIRGLIVGAAEDSEHPSGQAVVGNLTGKLGVARFYQPYFYTRYESSKLMLAAEYTRQALNAMSTFGAGPTTFIHKDQRFFYIMASYKLAEKLTGGVYYSSSLDRAVPVSSARYQKDWAISARYDINSFMYLKAEEHVMDGTELGYSTSTNTGGLKPDTRMTLLKLGVSF